ncbi:hypothetical protein D3C81_1998550 [compost metagenome]
MCGDNHRHAIVAQLAHDRKHLMNQFWIECGCRFVEEHNLRLHREGTSDSYSLFLATRELVGKVIRTLGEAYPLK